MFIRFKSQGVVNEDISADVMRSESPDGIGRQLIPCKSVDQKLFNAFKVACHEFDLFRQALFEWLSHHGHLVLLISGLAYAFDRRRVGHCLSNADIRFTDLNLHVVVEYLSQIIHDRVQLELTSADDDMFSTFLHFRFHNRITFANLSEAFQHLW